MATLTPDELQAIKDCVEEAEESWHRARPFAKLETVSLARNALLALLS